MLSSNVATTRARRLGREAEHTARFFQILADPTRVRIVELLLDGERNVSDLVDALNMQQGRVSSHLSHLWRCGLVTTRREGKYIYYRLQDSRLRLLLELAAAQDAARSSNGEPHRAEARQVAL